MRNERHVKKWRTLLMTLHITKCVIEHSNVGRPKLQKFRVTTKGIFSAIIIAGLPYRNPT